MKIVRAEQMRRIDEHAIGRMGIPSLSLMERAGAGVVAVMARRFGPLKNRRIAVVCGKGNNGGDGFVVARLTAGAGARAAVVLIPPAGEISGDARTNLRRWKSARGRVLPLGSAARREIEGSDLVVDAVFGTGLSQPVRGDYGTAIEWINASGKPVVSVDIPSGVNGSTGEIMGDGVRASITVALGLPKRGHVVGPGASRTGRLEVVDIGLPPASLAQESSDEELITWDEVRQLLPSRRFESHKGDFGHLLLVGGSRSKVGAIVLAARAALRSGAGLVTAAVPGAADTSFHAAVAEAMSIGLAEKDGCVSREAADTVIRSAGERSAVALGPGLGWNEETEAFVAAVVPRIEAPCVIDADGLNAIARRLDLVKSRKGETVLTPHPGEMSRLLGRPVAEVQGDRVGTARALASESGAVSVLKGARTVVVAPQGRSFFNPTGNPGMATGGTGDVLTGMIGALLAQGLNAVDAARAGVYLHGLAGDTVVVACGQTALIASDMIDVLPEVFLALERGFPPPA
ncbi:MAG: NAD(P)H-hydrate dehydratase [Nitrospirae bacterium]|nr:NAD(P)H-hydrate dehydratase [Nitrospirota bacterium]